MEDRETETHIMKAALTVQINTDPLHRTAMEARSI